MERKVVCIGESVVETIKVKVNRLSARKYTITIKETTYEVEGKRDILYAFTGLLEEIFPEYYEDIYWGKDYISFKGYTLTDISFRCVSDYNNSEEILQDILKNVNIAVSKIREILGDLECDVAEAEIIVYR